MKFTYPLADYVEPFLRLIYPVSCGLCGIPTGLEEPAFCGICADHVRSFGLPAGERALSQETQFIDQAWALYPYETPVKDILTAVKFSGKSWLLKFFRKEIAAWGAAVHAENSYDMIIPVPIDRARLIGRQFNQSEIIAQCAADETKIPVRRWLKKSPRPFAQSHLTRQERLAHMSGLFHLKKPADVEKKTILLVDDILTTGATAEEIARVLKARGASKVDVLVLAHTRRLRTKK